MANLYLGDTYLTTKQLKVVHAETRGETVEFAVSDVIGRPQGGGQPADRCSFVHGNVKYEIARTYKQREKPFHTIYEYAPLGHRPLEVGNLIDFSVHRERRIRLSRCHTLTHVVMAATRRCVPDYESRGAEILEDEETCLLWFEAKNAPSAEQLKAIDGLARSAIARALPVRVTTEPSVESAQFKYDAWRVDSTLELKGKIRVVLIGDDYDANPCSGTHVGDTSAVGAFEILGVNANSQHGCWEMTIKNTNTWSKWYND